MQKGIFDSKNKQRILTVFASQPRRVFSLKELSVRAGLPLATVKLIVLQLAKHRLLVWVEKNHQRYYRIDPHSPAYADFISMFGSQAKQSGKPKDLIEKIIFSAGDIRAAVLTGIFVGLPRAQVDLLLVGSADERRVGRAVEMLSKLAQNEINYAIMTESELRSRIFSFDWFLKEIIDRDPVFVIDRLRLRDSIGKLTRQGTPVRQEPYLKKAYSNLK